MSKVSAEIPSTLRELGTIPCPECEGSISYCEDEDDSAVILHTTPFCAWFELATIEDYRDALDAHPDVKDAVMRGRTVS